MWWGVNSSWDAVICDRDVEGNYYCTSTTEVGSLPELPLHSAAVGKLRLYSIIPSLQLKAGMMMMKDQISRCNLLSADADVILERRLSYTATVYTQSHATVK